MEERDLCVSQRFSYRFMFSKSEEIKLLHEFRGCGIIYTP